MLTALYDAFNLSPTPSFLGFCITETVVFIKPFHVAVEITFGTTHAVIKRSFWLVVGAFVARWGTTSAVTKQVDTTQETIILILPFVTSTSNFLVRTWWGASRRRTCWRRLCWRRLYGRTVVSCGGNIGGDLAFEFSGDAA